MPACACEPLCERRSLLGEVVPVVVERLRNETPGRLWPCVNRGDGRIDALTPGTWYSRYQPSSPTVALRSSAS